MQVKPFGTMTRTTLGVGMADATIGLADAFGDKAYQDTIGTVVETGAMVVHAAIGVGVGVLAAADGNHPAHQTAMANMACGELLKSAGYGAQLIGHPLIGLGLIATGAVQTLLGSVLSDHADEHGVR